MKAFLSGLSNFFNARLVLAAVLAAGTAATVGYYQGAKHTRNAITASLASDEQLRQETYEAAVRATADQISKIKIVNTTIRQELEREIRTEPVYLDCRHNDNVRRLLDAILQGEAPAESIIGAELPYVDGPD